MVEEVAQPSKKEWVEFRREQRDVRKGLAEMTAKLDSMLGVQKDAKPKPAPTGDVNDDIRAQFVQMQSKAQFQDALDEVDTSLTKGQRKRLQAMFVADKPADPASWLRDTLSDLGLEKPAATTATTPALVPVKPPPPQAQTRSDTGPPGSTHAETDYSKITREGLLSMTEDQRKKVYQQRRERSGGEHNPLSKAINLGSK